MDTDNPKIYDTFLEAMAELNNKMKEARKENLYLFTILNLTVYPLLYYYQCYILVKH